VSFALEDNTVPTSLPIDDIKYAVGIDVGLEKFLTTSDAEAIAVRIHNCPNCAVSLDRDYNASINVLKRTTGLSFATCGGLGVAQPMKQEISFVNLRSPRQSVLA
jgi:transposase